MNISTSKKKTTNREGEKLQRSVLYDRAKKNIFIVKVSNKDVSYLVTDNEVVSQGI